MACVGSWTQLRLERVPSCRYTAMTMQESIVTTATSRPPVLTSARGLLERYEAIFCDVWGVVHDGWTAYPGAMRALTAFRETGGVVVLVSNAPVPPDRVAQMLDQRAVPRTAWDAIVSSGGRALDHIRAAGLDAVYAIGPRQRDAAFFERLTARQVDLRDAEALVCTGLEDDERETVADYRPVLERARARDLQFICANPDLIVDVGGRHYPCAGALAQAYEDMGGRVMWAGKPHPIAFAQAQARAETILGSSLASSQILAIGDAIRTDLKSAEQAGVDALFIAAGIHRQDTMVGDAIDPDKLERMFRAGSPSAVAAMAYLDW